MQRNHPLDSTRFYAILDTAYVPQERWVESCRALLQGGADLVQLRAKSTAPAERTALLEEILPLFADRVTPLVINDDIDLALEYPGLGLHVGQEDLNPREARRRLGEDRVLGLSTHSPDQARAALELGNNLSYFAVGPVFATRTKPGYTPVGLDLVATVAAWERRSRSFPPWFCIGGITRENVHRVLEGGGRRVVVVSDVLCAPNIAEAVRAYQAALAEV